MNDITTNVQALALLQAIAEAISKQTLVIQNAFPNGTGTSATASGGAATLPANPTGFITTVLPDTTTTVKIPYYS